MALVPFIIVSTAYALYRDDLSAQLSTSRTAIEIIHGLATAGYAFGAMLGGDLINRFPQRILFLLAEGAFIVACALAGAAPDMVTYGAGITLQGLMTGLLLVIALPPVIRRFPPERLPITAAAINIGFFGAVTVGPIIGGYVGQVHVWRWFYALLGLVGAGVFSLALFTLADQRPPKPDLRFDRAGIALAFGATVLPFWGVAELSGPGFSSPLFGAPLGIGLICFVAMIVVEYRKQEPLAPVKQMWHTFPMIGTFAAMMGGAAFVTFLSLAEQALQQVGGHPALATGIAFWPEVPGVIISALALGLLYRTRYLPVLILAGMLCLIGAGVLLLRVPQNPDQPALLGAAALLGIGAGATVAPGLNVAALCLRVQIVGRTLALVELVRSVADYILAPVMLGIARLASGGATPNAHGIGVAVALTLMIAGAVTFLGIGLHLLGGARLPRPDIDRWLNEDEPALPSPLIAEPLRHA